MDEHMELRLLNPTEDGFLRKIEWNRSEIEPEVRRIAEEYKGLVYTEDTIPDAKKDRAYLRKLISSIEDRRKLVKKKINEPYEEFEAEVKEVVAIAQEQADLIDKQIKDYEDKSHKPKTRHPKSHTNQEIRWIRNYVRRNPRITLCELWAKLKREKGLVLPYGFQNPMMFTHA